MKELINIYTPESNKEEDFDFDQTKQEVEKHLEKIDINTIIDIFSDLKRKALGWERNSKEESDFRDDMQGAFKQRYFDEPYGAQGVASYDTSGSDSGSITFNPRRLVNSPGGVLFPKILKLVTHEMAHVASFSRIKRRHGLTARDRSFSPLDEAFTEHVADAVYSEYLRRTGSQDDATVISYGPVDVLYDREVYEVYRNILNVLIDEIAEESHVDKEIVIKSMLGHYLRADFFQELDALYTEIDPKVKEVFESLRNDPSGLGMNYNHPAVLEKRLIPKLVIICRELLKTREARVHVEALFGTDVFTGKKFVTK